MVERDGGRARITMFSGARVALEAGPDSLHVGIEAPDERALKETQEVVVAHLDRFAFREAPLPFDWSDATAPKPQD